MKLFIILLSLMTSLHSMAQQIQHSDVLVMDLLSLETGDLRDRLGNKLKLVVTASLCERESLLFNKCKQLYSSRHNLNEGASQKFNSRQETASTEGLAINRALARKGRAYANQDLELVFYIYELDGFIWQVVAQENIPFDRFREFAAAGNPFMISVKGRSGVRAKLGLRQIR
jgi:hypothetical protein